MARAGGTEPTVSFREKGPVASPVCSPHPTWSPMGVEDSGRGGHDALREMWAGLS